MPYPFQGPAAPRLFKPATLPAALQQLHQALAKAGNEGSRREAALAIIHEYYSFFGSTGVRQDMWHLLSGTLCEEQGLLKESEERAYQLFFYEFTLMLLDAGYVIHEVTKEDEG